MNELKNKSTILIIVALIVVCTGSFLGVRAVNKNLDGAPAASQSTYVPDSTTTTEPASKTTTTEAPSVNVNATVPSSNTITTFPGVSGTTSADVTTTLPITLPTELSTTLPTTRPVVQSTAPVLTLPTTTVPTTADSTTSAPADKSTTAASSTSNAGASTSAGQATTGPNGAMFENGLAGYKFDAEGNYYFTADDPWQRNFGYTQAFDTAAPFVTIYMDTMRAKFRYKNKDWMVQFWKGQYGLAFVGSEIGVYTKSLDRPVEYYDAASNEDALYMSCTCYRDGVPIFSREYGKYWWCTGFIPGQLDKFSDRSELMLKCRITLKDEEMLNLFVNALKSEPNNLVEGRHFAVNGLDVFITWQ